MILNIFQAYFLPTIVLAVIGGIFGLLISLASIAFEVEIDPRVEQVTNLLPGYNCGACGHPGCEGFANAVVFDNVDTVKCKPGKQDMRDKIKAYLEDYNQKQKENESLE